MKAIESVAKLLGNTRSVCRKSYIHPAVIDSYLDGATIHRAQARAVAASRCASLTAEERAVVALVSARLRRKTA